jgi:hypothetical protein
LMLRHASRSVRVVVDEDLLAFAAKHRMSGIILLRPLDRIRKSRASGATAAKAGAGRSAATKAMANKVPSGKAVLHVRKGRQIDV